MLCKNQTAANTNPNQATAHHRHACVTCTRRWRGRVWMLQRSKEHPSAIEGLRSTTERFLPCRMKSRLPDQGQRATSAAAPHPPHPPCPPVWIRDSLKPQLPSLHAALQGLTPPELHSSLTLTLKLYLRAANSNCRSGGSF